MDEVQERESFSPMEFAASLYSQGASTGRENMGLVQCSADTTSHLAFIAVLGIESFSILET